MSDSDSYDGGYDSPPENNRKRDKKTVINNTNYEDWKTKLDDNMKQEYKEIEKLANQLNNKNESKINEKNNWNSMKDLAIISAENSNLKQQIISQEKEIKKYFFSFII